MTALLEYLDLTALLEYIDLLNRYSRGPSWGLLGAPFEAGARLNAPVSSPPPLPPWAALVPVKPLGVNVMFITLIGIVSGRAQVNANQLYVVNFHLGLGGI